MVLVYYTVYSTIPPGLSLSPTSSPLFFFFAGIREKVFITLALGHTRKSPRRRSIRMPRMSKPMPLLSPSPPPPPPPTSFSALPPSLICHRFTLSSLHECFVVSFFQWPITRASLLLPHPRQSRLLARVRSAPPIRAQLRRGHQVLPERAQARAGQPPDPEGSRGAADTDP